jgi:hypothetical protein
MTMANKWQICIAVDEDDVDRLCAGLALVSTAATYEACKTVSDQIALAWIEKESELIPPPSRYSQHLSVYVHEDVHRG